jgi:hypothetical protein
MVRCTNLLCLPSDYVDACYFFILVVANLLNGLVAAASLYLMLPRSMRCVRSAELPAPPRDASISISLVVACYLPNEQAIIESTIEHMLLKLEHAGRLTLWVVYNTPTPLAYEERLQALDGREYAPNRVLRVVQAVGSTSKAENLNLVLQRVADPFVALYDADHHPDPDALQRLLATLLCSRCDAVQGSTYIRNARSSLLASLVNAEFFVTHFVYFPAMEVLAANAYFGGSNALWRTRTLCGYGFDETILTEDVDLSARALLDGHRIRFCPEARSGELSPAGARSLVVQRLRWFMGWEQVTHRYYWKALRASLPLHKKLGFCYMFHLRWVRRAPPAPAPLVPRHRLPHDSTSIECTASLIAPTSPTGTAGAALRRAARRRGQPGGLLPVPLSARDVVPRHPGLRLHRHCTLRLRWPPHPEGRADTRAGQAARVALGLRLHRAGLALRRDALHAAGGGLHQGLHRQGRRVGGHRAVRAAATRALWPGYFPGTFRVLSFIRRGCIDTAGGRFSRSTSGLEAAGLGGATLGRGGSPRDGVAAMEPACGGGSGGGGGSAAVDAPRLGSGAVRSGSGTAALRVPLLAAEESAAEAGGGPGEV